MTIIGINYRGRNYNYNENNERVQIKDKRKRIKYESVYIHTTTPKGKSKECLFKTGNFVKDWYDATKAYINGKIGGDGHLSGSSTVDHFIMDGAEFDSAYLHIENDKPVLKYIDRSVENWYLTDVDRGIEYFVKEGTTPTWEELREMCGDPKKVENE